MQFKLNKRQLEVVERHRDRLKNFADKFFGLSAEEKLWYIPEKHPPTEFEIQSFLYEQLLAMGYTVRGEVKTRCGTCIFDLVVYINGRPARVIEVKKKKREFVRKARIDQISRYQAFGLPVDLVCTLSAAREYIASIKSGETSI